VLQTFAKLKSESLQGFIVWVPVLAHDSCLAALDHIANDARLREGWDDNRHISDAFKKTLALHKVAWDAYMIYGSDVVWHDEKNPPMPTFWMHQLNPDSGADPKLTLQEDVFFKAAQEQLRPTAQAALK
jgi:hypothetical protein